jgi:hypothetical protein
LSPFLARGRACNHRLRRNCNVAVLSDVDHGFAGHREHRSWRDGAVHCDRDLQQWLDCKRYIERNLDEFQHRGCDHQPGWSCDRYGRRVEHGYRNNERRQRDWSISGDCGREDAFVNCSDFGDGEHHGRRNGAVHGDGNLQRWIDGECNFNSDVDKFQHRNGNH